MIIVFLLYFLSVIITYHAVIRDYVRATRTGYTFSKLETVIIFVVIPYIPAINLLFTFALWHEWKDIFN